MAGIHDLGPASEQDRALESWFEEQQRGNLVRLEEGAKTTIQLVGALYSVLFGILAFGKDTIPFYLRDPVIRWLGSLTVGAFFLALLGALVVLHPYLTAFPRGNLTAMRRAQRVMEWRKAWGLRLALVLFVVGLGGLGGLIGRILWTL